IQSKCGQVFPQGWQFGKPIRVDLTRKHLIGAAEESLKRLGTDYLDILLLHAPSTLVQPEEVAQACARSPPSAIACSRKIAPGWRSSRSYAHGSSRGLRRLPLSGLALGRSRSAPTTILGTIY